MATFCLNRTFMELKPLRDSMVRFAASSLNRTFMELKRGKGFSQSPTGKS